MYSIDDEDNHVLAPTSNDHVMPVSKEPKKRIVDPKKVKEALDEIYRVTGEWIGKECGDNLEIFRKGTYPYGDDAEDFLRQICTSITATHIVIFMKHLL